MIDKTIFKKYTDHKSKAKHRGIDFTLTFEEWWNIWEKSGKWEQRGMFKGSYVMSRNNDQGPYSIDNVKIQSVGANNQEAYDCHRAGPMLGRKHSTETVEKMKGRVSPNKGKILSQETKDKISSTLAGRKTGRTSSDFTPEWREKLSIAAKNRKKILNTSETII
jgi:hypothetical protein